MRWEGWCGGRCRQRFRRRCAGLRRQTQHRRDSCAQMGWFRRQEWGRITMLRRLVRGWGREGGRVVWVSAAAASGARPGQRAAAPGHCAEHKAGGDAGEQKRSCAREADGHCAGAAARGLLGRRCDKEGRCLKWRAALRRRKRAATGDLRMIFTSVLWFQTEYLYKVVLQSPRA